MSRASSFYPSPYARYRTIFLATSICVVTLFAGVLAARHSVAPVAGAHQAWQNDFDLTIESQSKSLREPLAAL
jgi:hypothetical protein